MEQNLTDRPFWKSFWESKKIPRFFHQARLRFWRPAGKNHCRKKNRDSYRTWRLPGLLCRLLEEISAPEYRSV